jgi:hypothetical protein
MGQMTFSAPTTLPFLGKSVPSGSSSERFHASLTVSSFSEAQNLYSLPYLLRQKWWTPTVTTTERFKISFLLTSHTSLWDKWHFPPQQKKTEHICVGTTGCCNSLVTSLKGQIHRGAFHLQCYSRKSADAWSSSVSATNQVPSQRYHPPKVWSN